MNNTSKCGVSLQFEVLIKWRISWVMTISMESFARRLHFLDYSEIINVVQNDRTGHPEGIKPLIEVAHNKEKVSQKVGRTWKKKHPAPDTRSAWIDDPLRTGLTRTLVGWQLNRPKNSWRIIRSEGRDYSSR